MFRYIKDRVVTWPVTVSVPADGGPERVEIKVRYRLLARSEMEAVAERLRAVAEGEGAGAVALVDDLLAAHIVGWEDIGDESGAPLPYSTDTARALLDLPYLREALEAGLYAASRGAAAKN